jgi:hypothetical protein
LEGFGGAMDLSFLQLLAAVRTGLPAAGVPELESSPELSASFDEVMEAQSRAQAAPIVTAFDWAEADHVVDLGGGTGTLLVELLRARPQIRGTLIERPSTAERATAVLLAAGLADRCEVASGDLFEIPLPRADVYVLKFVLHGFADADAVRALRRCHDAGGKGSRVLLVERTLAGGDDLQAFTAMDLRMLILGEGRERTREQFADLAREAGFMIASVEPAPMPMGPHLIELQHV